MRAVITLLITLSLAPAAVPAHRAGGGRGSPPADVCAAALEGWEKLADTSSAIPSFIIKGRAEVDAVLVCDAGVYFFFRAREWGRYGQFCLVYPKPSVAQSAKYYARGETDVQKRTAEVLATTVAADEAYGRYLADLGKVLGKKYREGTPVSFANERWQPRLDMELGSPIAFTWRRRAASFAALVDIYYVAPGETSPWRLFVLLHAGFL